MSAVLISRNSRTFQELQAAAAFSPLAASLVAKKATDYGKGFSPRVGFAYDLNGHGNHIVRAGFGMYYDNTFQNIPLFMEQQANTTIFQTAFRHQRRRYGARNGYSAWQPGALGSTHCRQFRLLARLDTRLNGPHHGPELSHPGDRGIQRRIYLGDQSASRSLKLSMFTCSACMRTRRSTCRSSNTADRSHQDHRDRGRSPNLQPRSDQGLRLLQTTGCRVQRAGVPVLGSVRDETSGGRSRYDGMNLSFRQRSFHKMDLMQLHSGSRAVGYDQDGGSFRYYPRDPQHPFAPERVRSCV